MAQLKQTRKRKPAREVVKEAFNSLEGRTNMVVNGVKSADGGEVFMRDDTPRPDEVLSELETGKKEAYLELLLNWIIPVKAGVKTTVEQDRASFAGKMNKQRLPELKRFFEIEIPQEVKDAIQRKYKDISP